VGRGAGNLGQGAGAVAIGMHAGLTNQAATSIAIFGNTNTAAALAAPEAGLYVKPIRSVSVASKALAYTSSSGEITENPNVSFTSDGRVGIRGNPSHGRMQVIGTTTGGRSDGLTVRGGNFSAGLGVLWVEGPGSGQRFNIQAFKNDSDTSMGVVPSIDDSDAFSLVLNPIGGRVGVGKTPSTVLLDVNGTVRASAFDDTSDDRIKYNEEPVPGALDLIGQLNPQKYEKIVKSPPDPSGTWIPTDEEWENVKDEYEYTDEFGFIAQAVRDIPKLAFLVRGDEYRTDTKTVSQSEYESFDDETKGTYTVVPM
jgi:hypothetical protein